MENIHSIRLDVSESDLSEIDKKEIESQIIGTRSLGANDKVNRRILDLLPSLIAKRVKDVIPEDFELESLQFNFVVDGKLFGSGISGEVSATLKRRSEN